MGQSKLMLLCSFLNIITELIAGYAWPGKPIANMMVKCYGYNSVKHGMDFSMDMKLGQYMVIILPPHSEFTVTKNIEENPPSRPLFRTDLLDHSGYRSPNRRYVITDIANQSIGASD
jgi:hypothetical protein